MDFCARKKEHTEKKEWKGIVWSPTHSHPFLKGGGIKFWLFPSEGGGICKIKKRGGSMVQRQVFLIGAGGVGGGGADTLPV